MRNTILATAAAPDCTMLLRKFKKPALRLDLLEPGDVILSHGGSLVSKVNLLFQQRNNDRRYSHAALVLDPCKWIESLRDGVLTSYVRLDKIEERNGEYRALHYLKKTDYKAISVFRHEHARARISTGRWRHVEETLANQSRLHLGYEYSKLSRMSDASPILRNRTSLRRAVIAAAILAERLSVVAPKWNPGLFCSELVAALYLSLQENVDDKLELLKEDRQAFTVSPSDLGDHNVSRLSEVQDCIVEVSRSPDQPAPRRWMFYPYFGARARRDRARELLVVTIGTSTEMLRLMIEHWEQLAKGVRPGSFESPVASIEDGQLGVEIDGRQELVNELFATFDARASAEHWDPLKIQKELSDRNSRLMAHAILSANDDLADL